MKNITQSGVELSRRLNEIAENVLLAQRGLIDPRDTNEESEIQRFDNALQHIVWAERDLAEARLFAYDQKTAMQAALEEEQETERQMHVDNDWL